jgi:Right handed beta helix region
MIRLSCLCLAFAISLPAAEPKTLRSFGAIGDGETDDRAAIQKALTESQGNPLDGEGASYAVRGNIEVSGPVDLCNATIRQVQEPADVRRFFPSVSNPEPPLVDPPEALRGMIGGLPWLDAAGVATYAEDPTLSVADIDAIRPSIVLRTLFIRGTEDKPVSVRLEKIRILRGDHPETGGRNDGAGLMIASGSPVLLRDVEVTGHGKGAGVQLVGCREARLERLNIHDMHWSLYPGDIMPTAASLKADWGWNNNPIYEFRGNRFARVRIQEQLSGLYLTMCDGVELIESTVERLGVEIDGVFHPWQADGITVGRSRNVTMRDCRISDVWEGIDFTGALCENFHQENITIADTFSYGFKYAHPKKNGLVVNCVSIRAGMTGFIIGSECDGVVFRNCQSLETGASGHWTKDEPRPNVSGFRLEGGPEGKLPRGVVLEDCVSINEDFPGAMAYGFTCPDAAIVPNLGNQIIRPVAKGFRREATEGFVVE